MVGRMSSDVVVSFFCRMMVTVLVVWKGRKGRKRRKSSVDEEAGDDPFHEGWSSVPCGSYS